LRHWPCAACVVYGSSRVSSSSSAPEQPAEKPFLLGREEAVRPFFTEESRDGVAVRLAGIRLLVENHRHAGVRRGQHRLAFGDGAEQVDCEDIPHDVDAQHLAALAALVRVTCKKKMLTHASLTVGGAARLAGENA